MSYESLSFQDLGTRMDSMFPTMDSMDSRNTPQMDANVSQFSLLQQHTSFF